jgi:hypothetical protein
MPEMEFVPIQLRDPGPRKSLNFADYAYSLYKVTENSPEFS